MQREADAKPEPPAPSPDLDPLPLVKNGDRLLDLVRSARHQLHDEELITDEEFADLVNVGSASARRLENYDAAVIKASVNARREGFKAGIEAAARLCGNHFAVLYDDRERLQSDLRALRGESK